MYLRRNSVKVKRGRRSYLSIAHNVWWTDPRTQYAQTRAVVLANLGAEETLDVGIARDLVIALDRSVSTGHMPRGEGRAATLRIAAEIRRIEPVLRLLADCHQGFARFLPPGTSRLEVLEALIRTKLADPGAVDSEEVKRLVRSARLQTVVSARLAGEAVPASEDHRSVSERAGRA